MTPTSRHWAERAHYDLDTGQAMFDSGRYLYVLFCCQQAVEKMLKALITQRRGEFPPRVHQLMRLAEVAGLKTDEDKANFLRQLSAYYIQTRYPEEMAPIAADEKVEASRILKQTKEVVEWLELMLQSD